MRQKQDLKSLLYTVCFPSHLLGRLWEQSFLVHGSIHVGQNLSFKRPLYPDKKYIVYIELVKIIKISILVYLKLKYLIQNNLIVDGTGTALHEEKL